MDGGIEIKKRYLTDLEIERCSALLESLSKDGCSGRFMLSRLLRLFDEMEADEK